MEKIKKVLFLTVFVVSLVTSSCSCEKHKDYIPADSKVLGKIDLKEFFKQSGVDKDKLMQDLEDYLGEDASIEKMGLDLSVPVYIFGHGKGINLSFGVVAKVDDSDKVKEWFDDKGLEIDTEEKKEGFDYAVHDNFAVGVNKDALVMLVSYGGESEAKKEIKKIMKKDFEGDIDDNKLMEKIKESKSFACLYADMSLLPSEAIDVIARNSPEIQKVLHEVSDMTIYVDATFQDGVCDFECRAESDNKDVQAKIDNMKNLFRKVDQKAIQSISNDVISGFVANFDGSKVLDFIKSTHLDDLYINRRFVYFNEYCDILNDVDGNVTYCSESIEPGFTLSEPMIFALESKNNTSSDIAKRYKELETLYSYNDSRGNSYDGDYGNDSISVSDSASSYSPPSRIQETSDGFCYDNRMWFGNKNGAFYLTNKESFTSSVFEKADKQVSSGLSSLMKDRKFTFFVNVKKAKEKVKETGSKEEKKYLNAFNEIIDKIDYVTFSMK